MWNDPRQVRSEPAQRGSALMFWIWMTVTVGGLAVMFAIVIGGR